MVAVADKKYSLEEYFALEETSELRHEFVHGTLIPMPGESKPANKIVGNCYFQLRTALKGTDKDIFFEDVRLTIEQGGIYRYPDLVVTTKADSGDRHHIHDPLLVIEVLSEATAHIDRGAKLREYCGLPSLHYYLIIAQDECLVETYTRFKTDFLYHIHTEENAIIELPLLGCSLKMVDVYEDVSIR